VSVYPNVAAAGAPVPYARLAAVVAGVVVVGLALIAGASGAALRGRLLEALRSE
jgi:hypothetical protein